MSEIPVTDKVVMRPVWARRQRRHYMHTPPGPPTDAEMHDAVLVLADASLQIEAPALWLEAEMIHAEATETWWR